MDIQQRDDRIATLVQNSGSTLREIGALFSLSPNAVHYIAARHGIRRSDSSNTESRDAQIVDLIKARKQSLREIGSKFGLSGNRIQQIGALLGVLRGVRKVRPLTPIEDMRLISLHERGMPFSHIAEAIGLSLGEVIAHLKYKGLWEPTREISAWSDQETAYLRKHYKAGKLSAADIGDTLGRTRNEIIGRANRLGLCRPDRKRAA